MTAVFADPFEEFLAQDPSILRESELTQEEAVKRGVGVVPVAIGLGAAYIVYRTYMARRMKEEVRKLGPGVTRKSLTFAASAIWNVFIPRWVSMTAPYIALGYHEGVQAAKFHVVPHQMLRGIAQDYSKSMGDQMNQTSTDAVLSGYQAQVNRKVPPIMAAQRVATAYGVTQRGMNTLVNVWTGDEAKKMTDLELPSAKAERAEMIINAQNNQRARQIGDNEYWAARTQGKQIVWMYGVTNGIIPATAQRVWITADDERVCPTCGPMSGVNVKVTEKFDTITGKTWAPPAHVNCRCDIFLDLHNTDVQGELDELIDAEAVSKAMGRDRFDRDRSGRFSRQEQRRAQAEDDQNFRDLMARLDRALKPKPQETKPVETAPIERGPIPITGPIISGPIQGGPIGIRGGSQPIEIKNAPIGQAPAEKTTGPRIGQPIDQGFISPGPITLMPIDAKPNPILHTTPQHIPAAPIDTGPGDTWEPLDYSLVAVMTQKEYDLHKNADESIWAVPRTPFYVKHDEVDTDGPATGLDMAIKEHWYQVAETATKQYKGADVYTYKQPSTGKIFRVEEDAYHQALTAMIEGATRTEGKALHWQATLYNQDDPTDELQVNSVVLAEKIGLHDILLENMPVLMETRHEKHGSTKQVSVENAEVYQNPGDWRETHRDEVYGDRKNHPFIKVEAIPTELGPI